MYLSDEDAKRILTAALAIESDCDSSCDGAMLKAGIIADTIEDAIADDKTIPHKYSKDGIERALTEAIEALNMQAVGCYTINERPGGPSRAHKTMVYENEGFLRGMSTRIEGIRSLLQEFDLIHRDAYVIPTNIPIRLDAVEDMLAELSQVLNIVVPFAEGALQASLKSTLRALDEIALEVSEANDLILGSLQNEL